MRWAIGGTIGVLVIALLSFVAPAGATGSALVIGNEGRVVTGEISRVIVHGPGWFDHANDADHDHDDDAHSDEPESFERVYVITSDGEHIGVPLTAAAGLETGSRVEVTLPAPGARSSMRIELLDSVQTRAAGAPVAESYDMKYAIVEITSINGGATQQQPPRAATIASMLENEVQDYFNAQSPGIWTFSAVSSHQVALDAGTCGRESSTASQVRRQLGIPSDVGLILTKEASDSCEYSGIALLGNGRPGGWIIVKQATARVLTHEIGHNLGLRHNRQIACGTQGRGCSGLVEFGGRSSVMGAAEADAGIALANHELWQLGMLGPGRMLSVPADSGSAILLEQHGPLAVTDDRSPTVVGGERVVRAIHLRESASEAWLSHRVMPAVNAQGPRGVVIHARTTWSDLVVRQDSGVPIELDVPANFYPGLTTSDRVAEAQNMLRPGSSFTTVGGTTVRVGELVTTPYGPGLKVTWTGSGVGTPQAPWPPKLTITIERPYGPTPYDVTPGERIPEGPATLALQGLKGSEFTECSIVDQAGRVLLSKRAEDLVPAPGSTWWGTIAGDGRFTGWAPASQKLVQASWRFPLIGGAPADGDSVTVNLTAGDYAWRTLCVTPAGQTLEYGQAMTATVFSANPSPSPTSPSPSPSPSGSSPNPSPTPTRPTPTGSPGTDTTAPYASDGTMALFGFAMRASVDHTFTNVRQIKPVLSLAVPGYADAESGIARRLGACTSLPVAESGRCEVPVAPGKGTVTAGAVDRAGNAAESSIDYDIQLVKLVRKTNRAWSVGSRGASPQRKGATASITVTGRQFMIIAACGASRGSISVSIGGSKVYPVDIKSIRAAACQPWGAEIPGGKSTLRITYTSKSPIINNDFIHAIAVIK